MLRPGSQVVLEGVGLNPHRIGLYDSLREMGAEIVIKNAREEAGEPVGDLAVRAGPLTGAEIPAMRAPSMIDEYPILAVAAAFAKGRTIMRGLGELRLKESDRLAAIADGPANGRARAGDVAEDDLRGGPAGEARRFADRLPARRRSTTERLRRSTGPTQQRPCGRTGPRRPRRSRRRRLPENPPKALARRSRKQGVTHLEGG